MFTVQLRNLFFKQNIDQVELLLNDERSTYAILRYAHDIPTGRFNKALEYLVDNIDNITDIRLIRFVNNYIKSIGVSFEFSDEFDHTLEITVGENSEAFGECSIAYDDDDDEE